MICINPLHNEHREPMSTRKIMSKKLADVRKKIVKSEVWQLVFGKSIRDKKKHKYKNPENFTKSMIKLMKACSLKERIIKIKQFKEQ